MIINQLVIRIANVAIVCLFILWSSPASAGEPIDVSLIQLIANPAAYHGKLVTVRGFLHNKFEDSALYLSKEDGDYLIMRNAVWVNYSQKILKYAGRTIDHACLDGKFVVLQGTFNKIGHGHMGLFSGELDFVSSGMEQKRYYNGKVEMPDARK